jgi:hypothetical protein
MRKRIKLKIEKVKREEEEKVLSRPYPTAPRELWDIPAEFSDLRDDTHLNANAQRILEEEKLPLSPLDLLHKIMIDDNMQLSIKGDASRARLGHIDPVDRLMDALTNKVYKGETK